MISYSFKFAKVAFYVPERGLSWCIFHQAREKWEFCCWMKSSLDISYIQLIGGTIELLNSARWICPVQLEECWMSVIIGDWSVFPCSSDRFCLIYFNTLLLCAYIKECYVFLKNWTPLSLCYDIILFISDNFPCPGVALSEIDIAVSTFLINY